MKGFCISEFTFHTLEKLHYFRNSCCCVCFYHYFKRLDIWRFTYSWISMPLIWEYLVFFIMKELTNFRLLDMDFNSVDLRGNIFLALYMVVIYSRITYIALLSSSCSLVHLLVHAHINVHVHSFILRLASDCFCYL